MTLEADLNRLGRAIDEVLVAGHGQAHWLRPDHPPFGEHRFGNTASEDEEATLAHALTHYGGAPSAAYDLWCMVRAVERLRAVWTGPAGQPPQPTAEVPGPPPDPVPRAPEPPSTPE